METPALPPREADLEAGRAPTSVGRFAAIFGSAIAVGQLGQLAWLVVGSRAMSAAAFAAVLTAQAVYGVLQFVADNGSAFHGARLAAQGALSREARGRLIRLRLQLAVLAAPVSLAVGAAGGLLTLAAVAPFALALALFALLSYWDRFGLGDSRPWSAYVVARALLPTAVAGGFLFADADFPVYLAGVAECVAVLAVAAFFRFPVLTDLRLALGASRGPWRGVFAVGLPTAVWQLGVAAGTVLLNTFGTAGATAALAVSVRLLTGLNQLAGVFATAFFPRLARRGRDDEAGRARAFSLGMRGAFFLVLAANALIAAASERVVRLFLEFPDRDADAAAILVTAASGATSLLVLIVMSLVAQHLERLALRACLVGTGIVLAGGTVVALAVAARAAVLMAAVLVIGQTVAVALLARRSAELLVGLRGSLGRGALAASALSAAGSVAAFLPATRPVFAVVFAAAALAALTSVATGRRSPSPAS